MNTKILFLIFYTLTCRMCCSFLYFPSESPYHKPLPPSDDVGKPLILTTLLKSNKISEARQRSSVPSLIQNVVSNAGYFTVEHKYDSNLFFWFIRAKDVDWQKAPLLLWLQGGPGCGSLFGLFGEHGPFFVSKGKARRRKYAWTNQYNVLYIDQPVGSGYSFTSAGGMINNQERVADHLYEALTQFFQLYPELKKNKFFITGESYAGKYVPAIGYRIHKLKQAGKCDFNLKGLFIVSAFSDPLNMLQYSDYAYKIGLVDQQTKNNMSALETEAATYVHSGSFKMAANKWSEVLVQLRRNSKYSALYDYTREKFFGDERYIEYLQSPEMRKTIHVGNATYDDCSTEVYREFRADLMNSTKPLIEELVEHYPMAFVGGQLDVITAYPLVLRVLQKLSWSGAFEYSQAKRNFLYDGDRVVGYSKVAGNLKEIFIRRAGHMLPADQPKVTLDVLQKFVDGKL